MRSKRNLAIHRCFALAALGLLVSACERQHPKPNATDPAGVYVLISVDGKPVPARVSHEGAMLEVRSGTFTVNADGTCSSKIVFVPPSGTEAQREVSATYIKEGAQLHMQWKGAGKTVGTLSGTTFTMSNEGLLFVYRK